MLVRVSSGEKFAARMALALPITIADPRPATARHKTICQSVCEVAIIPDPKVDRTMPIKKIRAWP